MLKAIQDKFTGGEGKEEELDQLPEEKPEKDVEDPPPQDEKSWDEMSLAEKRAKRLQIRKDMRQQLRDEMDRERKVDGYIAEKHKNDRETAAESTTVYQKGSGAHDFTIGILEILKCIAFALLAIVGFYIASNDFSLKNCGALETTTTVNYCTTTFANTSAGVSYQCVASGTTGCCDSSIDQSKAESERQGCISYAPYTSYTCLSNSEFEDFCKDDESCPGSIVTNFNTSIYLYAATLAIFAFIQGLRGYGLQQYANFHYLDFYEQKRGYVQCLFFMSAKVGTKAEQGLFYWIHLPVLCWYLYNDRSNLASFCADAKDTTGAQWEKPGIALSFTVSCFIIIGLFLVVSSLCRFYFPVRGEMYNPQEDGSQECNPTFTCLALRDKDCWSSWIWNSWCCDQDVYLKSRQSCKTCCCRSFPSCSLFCLRINRRTCGLTFWGIFVYPFFLISNIIFWCTFGILGQCLEYFIAYKHWIGI